MIVIGINGYSGGGKTTMSEHLFCGTNRKVVHLDHIFDHILFLIPRFILPVADRDNGEKVKIIPNKSIIRSVANNPCVSYVLWSYASAIISHLISKYEKQGFEYFIIEGYYLEKCINLSDLDFSIFIDAPLDIRHLRVEKRNTKEEIIIRGNNSTDINGANFENYNILVENNGSIDEYLNKIFDVEKQILLLNKTKIKKIH